jgi:YHS domain-containing protein
MKIIKNLTAITLTACVLAAPLAGFAEDNKDSKETKSDKKLVPDKLTVCPVSGDKLGEMGKPFAMEYKGQEVLLCCKSCKKDFEKEPAKYIKKIREADKAGKAADKKDAKN